MIGILAQNAVGLLIKYVCAKMAGKSNKREKMVADEAESAGWDVYGSGWPDFLLVNKKTKEVVFLEVKCCHGSGSPLRKNQKKIHKILKSLGLTVKTIRIGKDVGKHRHRVAKVIAQK